MKTYALEYNKDIICDKRTIMIIGVFFFIIATALSAYIRIPIKGSPVPITFQTFFVLLAGAVLGRKSGSLSQVGYIALGAAGLPLFQGSSFGFAYIFGPTAGYLAGFILAAYVIGRMIGEGKCSVERVAASFIIGDCIIHLLGASWLLFLYRLDFAKAASIGILPFIPGEIVKIFLVTILYSGIRRRSKEIFSI